MVSEKQVVSEKRKRGRPPAFSAEALAPARFQHGGEPVVRRTLLNTTYSLYAMNVLRGERGLTWLFDLEAMQASKPHSWRPIVLTELGRWRDPEDIRIMARAICKRRPRPTSQEAVRLLRAARLEAAAR